MGNSPSLPSFPSLPSLRAAAASLVTAAAPLPAAKAPSPAPVREPPPPPAAAPPPTPGEALSILMQAVGTVERAIAGEPPLADAVWPPPRVAVEGIWLPLPGAAGDPQAAARFARLTCDKITDLLDLLVGLDERQRDERRALVRRLEGAMDESERMLRGGGGAEGGTHAPER